MTSDTPTYVLHNLQSKLVTQLDIYHKRLNREQKQSQCCRNKFAHFDFWYDLYPLTTLCPLNEVRFYHKSRSFFLSSWNQPVLGN